LGGGLFPVAVSTLVRNKIGRGGEEHLTDEILRELFARGSTRDEWLALSHKLVATK